MDLFITYFPISYPNEHCEHNYRQELLFDNVDQFAQLFWMETNKTQSQQQLKLWEEYISALVCSK